MPFPEVVTRPEWASVNLDTLALVLDPVAARLEARLSSAGPLAGPLRAALSAALAAECGLVMGYVSQRVIGQYDVSLLGGDAPPRLLFVAPNLHEGGPRAGGGRRPLPALDLRPRAHSRLPVPGCALAARAT